MTRLSFPSEDKIFHRIEELCRLPHRRTGSAEGYKAAEYVKKEFERIGLQDVSYQDAPSEVFSASDYFLKVMGQDIPCFMINGTLHCEAFGKFDAGAICLNNEMIYLGEGRTEDFDAVDVCGKIVLCDCPWFDMDEDVYASKWCKANAVVYDPERDSRKKLRKTDSYSPNAWPYNYLMAQQKGAVGFVGILNDYFRDGINWNEDYSEIGQSYGCDRFELPGLWIGTDAAAIIKKDLEKYEKTTVSMGLKTEYKKGYARNVMGMLPGKSKDIIIVHSHYDAVFSGAVQDASGMAEVFALAEYFAAVPEDRRKVSMVFAGLDGHYTDYAGHQAFIESQLNKSEKEGYRIIADLVIEHIGKEVGLGVDNEPVVTDESEIRLIYISDELELTGELYELLKKYQLKRSIILPVEKNERKEGELYEFSQDEVISDAYYSHVKGVPIISMLSPQMYLFHPMDKPDMVVREELVPIGKMYADLIEILNDRAV